jgi:hypothetical protein
MDTKMKSLNVKEEDIEEGEAAPVEGETLAKDMKSGYGSPPSMKGVGAFNKSLFKSASAAKAGSPCDIKPEKKDSKLVWEDGKSSEEKPIDGFYGESPNDPDDDDEDKKKDVKKSFFISAELSKAVGPKPVVKPVPAPKGPVKGPDHYKHEGGSPLQYYKFGPDAPGESDVYMRKQNSGYDKGGYIRDLMPPEEMDPVYKPLKFDPKKHAVNKSITELRYGAQPLRAFEINKSCGVCGRLTKSCGGNEASGCCEDCKKSMNSVRWHESHLA